MTLKQMQAQLREILMDKILLNPGPTNTSEEVKDSQHRWSDVCHRTDEFVELLIDTKEKILKRFSSKANSEDWNVSIIAGSGTTAMDALISSLLDNALIIVAGKYGTRAKEMSETYNVRHQVLYCDTIEDLRRNTDLEKIYFVENETTTGEKFDPALMSKIFPNARLYLDATSSFGAARYDKILDKIDAISFCSNKCLQSTPGLGLVIWRKKLTVYNRSYFTNLGKYRISGDLPFTLPTQALGALNVALDSEDNLDSFNARRDRLIQDFKSINIECINLNPSNSIIGFVHPNRSYTSLKYFLESRGIVIYSGIPEVKNSFRVSTMSTKFDKEYKNILEAFSDSCLC